jgi:hypothetical protein
MLLLPRDFEEFLKLLNLHRVKYLLIGGYAVAYYGYVRATNDMDVWIAPTQQNARRLERALKDFGFDDESIPRKSFFIPGGIVRMGVPPMRIEIINQISGVSFSACFKSRVRQKIGNITVNLIDLKHLKVNKKASGRHKDLADLENLP